MKFSIGDKIILKHTNDEGIVTGYINAQMVEVEVHGTTFPVYVDEIDHPYLKWFTEKKQPKPQSPPEQLPVEKEKFRKPRLAKGIYLSFLPVFKTEEMEDIVDHIRIYLLNELQQSIGFKYDVRFQSKTEFRHEGKLHAFGSIFLHSIAYDDMNDQPRFHWQFINIDSVDNENAEGILRIKPVRLFEHINQLLQKNEATFNYLLIDNFQKKQKDTRPEKIDPVFKPAIITPTSIPLVTTSDEIDLHIEKLVDNKRGLSNNEMLQIQINALKKVLDNAILYRQERLYIIHGLGKGVLRDEVHKILRDMPEVQDFKNDYHGKYGFGATEVHFKY
jgi:hypothetical protein